MSAARFVLRRPPPKGGGMTGAPADFVEQEPVAYVELPLNGRDTLCRKATEADKAHYPDAWAAYLAEQAAPAPTPAEPKPPIPLPPPAAPPPATPPPVAPASAPKASPKSRWGK